ncbi:NRT1/ PTR family 8.2-like protein [Tanacetum coccineum]
MTDAIDTYNKIETEEDDVYTKDGTLDYKNNRANKNTTGTWKACPYILGNECCERLAYYGMSTNLVLYFKHNLNQHSATASKNLSNWQGTCYITPLIGAFAADAYLGRYWTIAIFSVIYVLLEALGTGGIKPCVSSYGADQFDDADEKEKNYKSSFFNWFYFSINIGALIASSVLVWIQDNVGWGWGFGIPAVAMAIAVGSFFSGTRLYRNQKPSGSPLTQLLSRYIMASLERKRKCFHLPNDKSALYEIADNESAIVGSRKLDHTKKFSFLDKAAVETPSDKLKESVDPWQLCTKIYRKQVPGPTPTPKYGDSLVDLHFSQCSQAGNPRIVPQYFLIGCAEVFTFIGQLEFFYQQAPDSVRSLCSALSLTTVALGSYLSSLLVTIVTNISTKGGKPGWIPDNLNRGQLQNFFWLLAILSVLNFGAFLLIARWYSYKKPIGTLSSKFKDNGISSERLTDAQQ